MRALVMEVVEGPTLAERIQQGSIPIDEAIAIAKQMAEALEYAHERSIIHRDLKPANLKLTEEGDVKLLDFGLAKALEGDTGKAQDDSHSPTLTRVTEAGVLLGTAGYMSPEQAKGKPVDRRADIWAFGVVLFEMLTGQRLFAGETASETLAFVMTKEPSFEALPSGTPASVHELLRRCLTKDPRMRLQAIGEARVVLSEPVEEAREAPRARRPTFLPWVVAATCAAVAIVALWPRARTLEAPVRLNAELGAGLSLDWSEGTGAVLSPDGSTLAFVARESGSESSKLFVRPLEQPHATPLAGTDGADGPFFSPDGEWIGFFVGDSLRKIQVGGGGSVTLTGVSRPRGAWWGDDGVIALATGHSHGPHEDLVVGRRGRAPDRARRLRARDHPSLAADLAGKQGHRVHRCSHGWGLQQRQYRRDVARDRRTSHRSSRRVPRTVSSERAHRLPSRSDALCGTIRSGGARDHGPAHPGHRRRRLRQQRRRPIRPVGQRHAGVFRGGGLRQSYNSVDAARWNFRTTERRGRELPGTPILTRRRATGVVRHRSARRYLGVRAATRDDVAV